MANVLPREKQLQVLHLLVEGSSIRACERVTGVHRDTICRLIVKFGNACREWIDAQMQGLTIRHLELDEQWTYCGKKQARLTVDEKQTAYDQGDIYLWVGIDQDTRLVPSFALGKRSADMARRFTVDLADRLTRPNPHASDANVYQPAGYLQRVQLSTDGFAAYGEAIDLAFGPYGQHGVIIKEYKNAHMKYDPNEMVATERRVMSGGIDEFSICTSHVERFNGTTRLFMKRFNRLTYCFSKKLENLAAATAMYLAYYNYCWQTRYPDKSGRPGTKRPTAAMMAKLTGHIWSFAELFETVMPAKVAA
jgi:IS1 family transposase